MPKNLTLPQKNLADFMSELSEQAFNAGWIEGLELALWKAMHGEQKKFGRLTFNEKMLTELKRLSQAANGWIIFDAQKEETFVSFEEWRRLRLD